jgi:cytochrome P450
VAFFDPTRSTYLANPYPSLAALRKQEPVHWSVGLKAWVPTRFEECSEVLHDTRRFTSDPSLTTGARAEAITAHRASMPLGSVPHLGSTSGEAHRAIRRLVNPVFTASAARVFEPVIRGLISDALAALPLSGTFEFMATFADPLPKRVMAAAIGCPPADSQRLHTALNVIEVTRSNARPSAAHIAEAESARAVAAEVLAPLMNGVLAPASVLGELMPGGESELSVAEITSIAAHIATVGADPTTGALANSMKALAANPEAACALRENPEKMHVAVHELLRYDSPSHIVPRFAAIDTELGGKRVRRGDAVLAMVGAANRDPAVFSNPDKLDIERDARRQLGFGQGEHICLGAPLALMILEIALNGLLARFERFELAEPPEYGPSVQLRVPDRLVLRCG